MSIASRFEPFDREEVFYDRETWEAMFDEALKQSPDAAESLGWLLYRIIRELDDGEGEGEGEDKGRSKRGFRKAQRRVINTLKLGVEFLYRYTDAHKGSFQGFLYHLEGLLVPGDFPEELMKSVIERGEEEARRLYGPKGSKGKRGG